MGIRLSLLSGAYPFPGFSPSLDQPLVLLDFDASRAILRNLFRDYCDQHCFEG